MYIINENKNQLVLGNSN